MVPLHFFTFLILVPALNSERPANSFFSAQLEKYSFSTTCAALPWLHPCEENGYDRMTPPQYAENGKTTDVKIQIHIESIGNFKAASMDYDMDIYFVEFWLDARLRHNHSTYLSFNDRAQLDRLWLPDLYFANSKTAEYNYVTVPNLVLKLYPDGAIRLSIRVHLKVSCHMNLEAFPLDRQMCYLKIVTYGSTTNKVNATWVNDTAPITKNAMITDTDLTVDRIEATYCDGKYFDMEFNCLLVKIHLKRDIMYSFLQTYAPTTFIVVISWMSFWIDPNSVPGRVGLSVTALLTLSTHAIGMHYQLPPVSYPKAQDVWFGMCILYLFASLVEFALVNVYTRRSESVQHKLRVVLSTGKPTTKDTIASYETTDNNLNLSPSKPLMALNGDTSFLTELALTYRKKALSVDRYSRLLFPLTFICFCIIYWCVYLLVVARPPE